MTDDTNKACPCHDWAREPLTMETAGTHHERCPNRPIRTPWDRANAIVNTLISPTPHFRDSRQVIADAIKAAENAAYLRAAALVRAAYDPDDFTDTRVIAQNIEGLVSE